MTAQLSFGDDEPQPERLTRRERMERRAERRLEWADSREAKSDSARAAGDQIGSHIPMGQPILVGHHSEKRHRRDVARMHSAMDKTVEHAKMADHHRSRAAGIERQLKSSIYSDDHDAIERLDEKISLLEGERDRWKAFNAACRKAKVFGKDAFELLDEAQRKDYVRIVKYAAFQIRDNGSVPPYVTSNLGANITRLRKRRDEIASKR